MSGGIDRQTPQLEERQTRTVASALAIAILEEQIRKTGRLGIPSLNVTLTKE